MELRFAEAGDEPVERIPIMAASDHACRWCGFRSVVGQIVCIDDGEPHLACPICHDARHATTALSRVDMPARLIWCPEIGQVELAHLVRTALVVRKTYGVASSLEKTNADMILRDLAERAAPIRSILVDLAAGGPEIPFVDLWNELDEDTRERLLGGLRLMPTGIRCQVIDDWVEEEGSLNGFGEIFVGKEGWFVDEIGLRSMRRAAEGE